MTDPTLSTRVASATGPDRELDAEVAVAFHLAPGFRPQDYRVPLEWEPHHREGFVAIYAVHDNGTRRLCHTHCAPPFTASVDVAMMAVPDNLYWIMAKGRTRPDEPLFGAQIFSPDDHENPIAEAETNTSATVALLAAALKARGL